MLIGTRLEQELLATFDNINEGAHTSGFGLAVASIHIATIAYGDAQEMGAGHLFERWYNLPSV